jgi:hypothetical protein
MDINRESTFKITSTASRLTAEDRSRPGEAADQAGTLNRINPN